MVIDVRSGARPEPHRERYLALERLTGQWRNRYNVAMAAVRDANYDWAEYLIYLEAGAEMEAPAAPKHSPWPGVAGLAALAAGVYALVQSGLLPKALAEPVTVALPLGMLIGNLAKLPDSLRTGVRYTIKTLLTAGIILMGARLDFSSLTRVGGVALLLSLTQVALLVALAWTTRRWLGLGEKQATLLGVGTAICGGSAILATAPVIEAEDRDVAFSVAAVSFLGLGTMFLLPFAGQLLGLSGTAFGIWAGLAIHQTPQVVAAGLAYSPEAGETATLVKLARVCLLAPMVLAIGVVYRRRTHRPGRIRKKLGFTDFVPPMVGGFLALALLHSLGWLPSMAVTFPAGLAGSFDVGVVCKWLSGFLLAMGMAAVGMETSFRSLRNVGWRPLAAGFALAAVGVLASLAAVLAARR